MKQNDWLFFVPPAMLMLVFAPILIPPAILIYAAWIIVGKQVGRNDRIARMREKVDAILPNSEVRSYLLLLMIVACVVIFAFGFCFGWPNR